MELFLVDRVESFFMFSLCFFLGLASFWGLPFLHFGATETDRGGGLDPGIAFLHVRHVWLLHTAHGDTANVCCMFLTPEPNRLNPGGFSTQGPSDGRSRGGPNASQLAECLVTE